ncbi:MAG: hypothetical protein D5R98_08165 [Desulfonatronovibrio sp. MSAO_Bac4]|nr:MAG: hypothetical protein D5R98_08165 [Desulfonatronovibrio sp. MSAO_Bac4]
MKLKSLIAAIASLLLLGFTIACDPPEDGAQQVPPPAPEQAPGGYEQPGTTDDPYAPGSPGDEGYGQPDGEQPGGF